MKNGVLGMLCRVALRTDISKELSVSFIRETRIGELGTTLAAASNRRHSSLSYQVYEHVLLEAMQHTLHIGISSHGLNVYLLYMALCNG
jgi:hypothetical protein